MLTIVFLSQFTTLLVRKSFLFHSVFVIHILFALFCNYICITQNITLTRSDFTHIDDSFQHSTSFQFKLNLQSKLSLVESLNQSTEPTFSVESLFFFQKSRFIPNQSLGMPTKVVLNFPFFIGFSSKTNATKPSVHCSSTNLARLLTIRNDNTFRYIGLST